MTYKEKYEKAVETAYNPLFTNNSRRRKGLKPRRKLNRRKRFYTLRECDTTITAWLDWINLAVEPFTKKYKPLEGGKL